MVIAGGDTTAGCANTQAAPTLPLSAGPPTIAVLPSEEIATAVPSKGIVGCDSRSHQRRALLGPDAVDAGEHPCGADGWSPAESADQSTRSARQGGVAISGERDRLAQILGSRGADAGQFAALLSPLAVGAREHPHRTCIVVVAGPAGECGVPIGR